MKKKLLIPIVIVLLVVFGFTISAKADLSLWDRIANIAGNVLGERLADKVDESISTDSLGAMPGPSIYTDVWCINGVCDFYNTLPLSSTATTTCYIQSPLNSTSTLMYASFQIDKNSATTTASLIEFGKNATTTRSPTLDIGGGLATTTKIGDSYALGSKKIITLIASSTDSNNIADTIFAPGEWLVVRQSGAVSIPLYNSTHSPRGACQAVFRVLND